MDYTEFSWERAQSLSRGSNLSVGDIETMKQLLLELRDLTQSRASYVAASDFLRRLGEAVDTKSLVNPDR